MKTVIEMALEAGCKPFDFECTVAHTTDLERFAELVRADAIADEREACAQIVETPVGEYEVVVVCGGDPTQRRIPMYLSWNQAADAIRSRSSEH